MSGPREVLCMLEEFNRLSKTECAPYLESLFGEVVDDDGVSDYEECGMVLPEFVGVSDTEEPVDDIEPDIFYGNDDDDEKEPPIMDSWRQHSVDCATKCHNIVRQRNGPNRRTLMYNIQQTFNCYMSIEMVDMIRFNKKISGNVCCATKVPFAAINIVSGS